MKVVKEMTLAGQRELLREQLHTQRQVIYKDIVSAETVKQPFPRSITMRLLTQQPVVTMVAEISTLLLGARFLKSVGTGIAMSKMMRMLVNFR